MPDITPQPQSIINALWPILISCPIEVRKLSYLGMTWPKEKHSLASCNNATFVVLQSLLFQSFFRPILCWNYLYVLIVIINKPARRIVVWSAPTTSPGICSITHSVPLANSRSSVTLLRSMTMYWLLYVPDNWTMHYTSLTYVADEKLLRQKHISITLTIPKWNHTMMNFYSLYTVVQETGTIIYL